MRATMSQLFWAWKGGGGRGGGRVVNWMIGGWVGVAGDETGGRGGLPFHPDRWLYRHHQRHRDPSSLM